MGLGRGAGVALGLRGGVRDGGGVEVGVWVMVRVTVGGGGRVGVGVRVRVVQNEGEQPPLVEDDIDEREHRAEDYELAGGLGLGLGYALG